MFELDAGKAHDNGIGIVNGASVMARVILAFSLVRSGLSPLQPKRSNEDKKNEIFVC